MLLLWILYVISVLFCYAFMHVCLLIPCGHLPGRGWPLGSRSWCLIVTLSLSNWYPGSGVVLDCIDSWSLSSFLLCTIVCRVYICFLCCDQDHRFYFSLTMKPSHFYHSFFIKRRETHILNTFTYLKDTRKIHLRTIYKLYTTQWIQWLEASQNWFQTEEVCVSIFFS